MPNRLDVMTIVQHVSKHLRIHPQACDTPEGIARWWVDMDGPEPVPVPVVTVEAALDCLLTCGVVEAQTAIDGRVRYRRRADVQDDRLDAIAQDPESAVPKHTGPADPDQPPRTWH